MKRLFVTLDKKGPGGETSGKYTRLSTSRCQTVFNACRARQPDLGTDGISLILEIRRWKRNQSSS